MLFGVALLGVDNFCGMVGPAHLPYVRLWVSVCDKTAVVSFFFFSE